MLINFRVPEDLVEAFDDTCRFKSMNRTAYEMTGKTPINRL